MRIILAVGNSNQQLESPALTVFFFPRRTPTSRRFPAVPPLQPEQQQAATEAPKADAPRPDACPTCGVPLSEKAFGCDGSGRIAGGIGAVPGFGWWPIKAYRPCPKAGAAGVAYQRKGQITDEVLFGRGRGQ